MIESDQASLFQGSYKNKRVLVTGHTGFKGSWLSLWLNRLGAQVMGYSKYLPSDPCNFEVCHLESEIEHVVGDVCDYDTLYSCFERFKPDIVFHLAAQPIVKYAYEHPKLNFDTNIGGTTNVLECLRVFDQTRAAVIITSDKCYANQNWTWGYRESDRLGGKDPYSASKGAAEIVFNAYYQSFFQQSSTHLSSVRAGNVIGGGDWAEARIVPDCIRAWSAGKAVTIRNPHATRPWQHVLEPLSGYLCVGASLLSSAEQNGESYNFGPDTKVNATVKELIDEFLVHWNTGDYAIDARQHFKEDSLLKLSCDKALHKLHWHSVLNFEETVAFTASWYKHYYDGHDQSMKNFTANQIDLYVSKARDQGLAWTKPINSEVSA